MSSTSKFDGFKHFGRTSITITWMVAIYQLATILLAPFIFAIGHQTEEDPVHQSPFGWTLILFCITFVVLILLFIGLMKRSPFLILPHLILWGLYVLIFVINSISLLFHKTASHTLMSIFIIIFFVTLVLTECVCFKELYKKSKKVAPQKETEPTTVVVQDLPAAT